MINIKFPIQKGKRGFFETSLEENEVIRNKILILFNTFQYERVFNPNFGINFQKYLFNPITDLLKEDIKNEIREKINIYIPEISIKNLNLDISEDYIIKINLIFTQKNDYLKKINEFNFEFNLK